MDGMNLICKLLQKLGGNVPATLKQVSNEPLIKIFGKARARQLMNDDDGAGSIFGAPATPASEVSDVSSPPKLALPPIPNPRNPFEVCYLLPSTIPLKGSLNQNNEPTNDN